MALPGDFSMHCSVRAQLRACHPLVLGTLFVLSGAARVTAALPAGFEEVTLNSGLSAPTALEWLPDGRILIADPFRRTSFTFLESLEAEGWTVGMNKWTVGIVPPERAVGVFELTPPVPR